MTNPKDVEPLLETDLASADVRDRARLMLSELAQLGAWPAHWRARPLAAALLYAAGILVADPLTQEAVSRAMHTTPGSLRRYLPILVHNLGVYLGDVGPLHVAPRDSIKTQARGLEKEP